MTNKQGLEDAVRNEIVVTADEAAAVAEIMRRIPGWSGCGHYAFFRELLSLPDVNDVLILGVYHGRDMALIAEAARRLGRSVNVTGVDRFTSDPCADWAPTNKRRTWEEEAKGPPPDFEAAVRNTAGAAGFRVIRSDDFTFLDGCAFNSFDAVYLDTAHDYNTVVRQLRQVRSAARPGAVICGDDFSDQYTWGVKSAVQDTFKNYLLFAGWIWAAFYEEAHAEVVE